MKRYLLLILVAILVLASGVTVSCGQKAEPAPEATPTPIAEDWEALNRWLGELYGLPPVSNTEQLKSAAFLLQAHWFKVTDEAVKKLEKNGIPWQRTAPFFYLYYYYILHDIQLGNASTPLELMAADYLLAQSVKDLHDEADELVWMKALGEPLVIYPTEEAAKRWFLEFDKDYVKRLEEAMGKGK